jgi:hypothetical protein
MKNTHDRTIHENTNCMRHATNATEKPILSRRHGHPRSEEESPATKHAKLAIAMHPNKPCRIAQRAG